MPATPPRIAVVGLGYVGLPVAVAFARRFAGTIGYDRDPHKVQRLREGQDPTGSVSADDLAGARVRWTDDPADISAADLYVLAIPTPIDERRQPDLSALREAGRTVGEALRPGDVVVLESTVYPGVTEEVLAPILEEASGLTRGDGFRLGYSPERINPGDPEHTFERTPKVVAAEDAQTLARLVECYGAVVEAGVHAAPSIRVAEAAKVIENVQRDLNIALVNELAMLFDRLDLDTREVLEAAGSKWNFHDYHPGLVGGHCIGVDPYYLTEKARSVGFEPRVILAGRRTNDGMETFVADKVVELLAGRGVGAAGARVAVLGLTFKPDVRDMRNSRVPGLIRALEAAGARVLACDPLVSADDAEEAGLTLSPPEDLRELDAVVLAVPHAELLPLARALLSATRVLVDVSGAIDPRDVPAGVDAWRL